MWYLTMLRRSRMTQASWWERSPIHAHRNWWWRGHPYTRGTHGSRISRAATALSALASTYFSGIEFDLLQLQMPNRRWWDCPTANLCTTTYTVVYAERSCIQTTSNGNYSFQKCPPGQDHSWKKLLLMRPRHQKSNLTKLLTDILSKI